VPIGWSARSVCMLNLCSVRAVSHVRSALDAFALRGGALDGVINDVQADGPSESMDVGHRRSRIAAWRAISAATRSGWSAPATPSLVLLTRIFRYRPDLNSRG
jgi:hypothetical protein